jgi:formamidopyrimidine-DNA glycosylase
MPELPEVEATRLKIAKVAKNQKIKEVIAMKDALVFDRNSQSEIKKALLGAVITGAERRGKYFWLKLDRKPWLVIHLGMSGSFEVDGEEAWVHRKKTSKAKTPVAASKKVKPRSRAIRLELILANGMHLVFKDPRRFGRVRLAKDPLHEPPISNLGFDPLFNFPTAKALYEILHKRKAPLKAVLLDQSVFAGVGNWIADEILYQSRLSPYRAAVSLTPKEVSTLRTKLLAIIRFAVKVSADKDHFPDTWLFHHRWSKGASKKNVMLTARGEKISYETVGGRTTAWVRDLQK